MSAKDTAQTIIDGSVEDVTTTLTGAAEGAQRVGAQLTSVVKQAGLLGVDNVEKSVALVGDLQKKVAGATGLDWLQSLVDTQAGFVSGLSEKAAKAARTVLE